MRYAGCTSIFGGFYDVSHVFKVITDDAGLIAKISAAVEKNKATPKYRELRAKFLKGLPALAKENARKGEIYAWNGGWIRLTRAYRISEEEANDHALLYLDRFECVDDKGMTHGGALPGSDQLKSTKDWKLE